MGDTVTVRIPASTPHIGLIRATASALAALLDFTYDRIMDLHIAIDEVSSRVIASSGAGIGRLEATFRIVEGDLEVTVEGDVPMKEGARFLTPLSRAILDSVTAGIEVSDGAGGIAATFRVSHG